MEYKMSNFILKYFTRHLEENYPNEKESILQKASVHFNTFMQEAPDMGKNMMASNIDLVAAFFAFYEASDHRISGEVIEILINWLADDYQKYTFLTDMNKRSYVRPIYYKVYASHARKVEEHKAKGEWKDTWSFEINPDGRKEGIYYHMKNCPLLKFVKDHHYDDMMPYICKFDFIFERILHAKLIRHSTEATGGEYCDYWFVPDQSETAKQYKDFISK